MVSGVKTKGLGTGAMRGLHERMLILYSTVLTLSLDCESLMWHGMTEKSRLRGRDLDVLRSECRV